MAAVGKLDMKRCVSSQAMCWLVWDRILAQVCLLYLDAVNVRIQAKRQNKIEFTTWTFLSGRLGN